MTEVDLLERGPRLRRFAISLLVAIAVGVVVALAAMQVAGPEHRPQSSRRCR